MVMPIEAEATISDGIIRAYGINRGFLPIPLQEELYNRISGNLMQAESAVKDSNFLQADEMVARALREACFDSRLQILVNLGAANIFSGYDPVRNEGHYFRAVDIARKNCDYERFSKDFENFQFGVFQPQDSYDEQGIQVKRKSPEVQSFIRSVVERRLG